MSRTADVWILGVGRFGRQAVETLQRVHPSWRLMVIDVDPVALQRVHGPNVWTRQAEGVDFLARNLTAAISPVWIVPALPVHLAFFWLLTRLDGSADPLMVPGQAVAGLPNPEPAVMGGFLLSYARSLCPSDCVEPEGFCQSTGEPRGQALHEAISGLAGKGYAVTVIQSRQLAPGVGGFPPSELLDLERSHRSLKTLALVATACRCHGVLHGLGPARIFP
jgi:hypothetical protein